MNNKFFINSLSSNLNYWISIFIVAGIFIFPGTTYNYTNHEAAGFTDNENEITASTNNAITQVPETVKLQSTCTDIQDELENKKHAGPFDMLIFQAANQYQVEPALIKAIIMAESGYNPKALSKKGAQGLMQLMPRTAKWLGVADSFNPEHNINGGVKYFKQLLVRFNGDVELALAAYNAGSRYVRQYNGVPPFKATKFYIAKVFKYYDIYKKQVT
ncbi:MAG: lytic transglycosylase domain-containing protein [Deltaproteobacteria bacterium]|nr:lytic transglycosylase domain-containing protein [Deltaproteobacteria bacterium]